MTVFFTEKSSFCHQSVVSVRLCLVCSCFGLWLYFLLACCPFVPCCPLLSQVGPMRSYIDRVLLARHYINYYVCQPTVVLVVFYWPINSLVLLVYYHWAFIGNGIGLRRAAGRLVQLLNLTLSGRVQPKFYKRPSPISQGLITTHHSPSFRFSYSIHSFIHSFISRVILTLWIINLMLQRWRNSNHTSPVCKASLRLLFLHPTVSCRLPLRCRKSSLRRLLRYCKASFRLLFLHPTESCRRCHKVSLRRLLRYLVHTKANERRGSHPPH
jgi:hypothetical protein